MATTRLQIGPADHGRQMSLDEFREADEEPGHLYELARGVLEVSEVPNDPHAKVLDNLHEVLSAYRRQHPGLIWRIGHGSDVRYVIPEVGSDRHPDLAVVFKGAGLDDRGRRRADLAVEVVSPGAAARHRDYEEKRDDYLAFGVLEYWVVDPERRVVTVLLREEAEGGRWSERSFQGAEPIEGRLLPGLQATPDDFWSEAGEDR